VSEFPDITLHALGAGGATGRIIEAIAASYEENLGVKIEIQQTDWATFLSDLNRPDNTDQMWGGEAGWIADYPDPHDFLDVNFRCGSPLNHTGYCNSQMDELLDQAAAEEKDAERRQELYRQVEQIVVDEAPWIPLFFGVDDWLVKPYVKDAYLPPMVVPRYQYYSLER
jgi:oligopeptide transport system substrate-binding protein